MRPKHADDVGSVRDRFQAHLRAIRSESALLGFISACAAFLILSALASALRLVPSWAMSMTGIATGGVAGIILASAAYLMQSVGKKLTRIEGGFSLVQRRNEIDPLTGAELRNPFLENFAAALGRRRKLGGSVALVVFDVDHFKQINDGFGHPTGDAVLKFCVRVARQCFHRAVVGRMGGDEFALFIEHGDPITAGYLERACSEFLSELREGFYVNHRRQSVSVSLGIAGSPADGDRADTLYIYADMALYQSKKAGRGTWSFFSSDILADKRQERFIERELRAAILMQELKVLYQPIVTADGKVHSFESLVRWLHPVRGQISPAEFIPIAERTRLIHDLGLAVLRRVCRDAHSLPPVPINVNISARQLQLDHFGRDYLAVLEGCGVEPSRIVLEITESSLLEVSESLITRISALRAVGFRIALDDFGMGYSEFNQLRTLPFDIIKIDKSYIQSLGSDKVTDVFVRAVVAVARHLERDVIAEGIEINDDVTRASAAGCRLFQGYLFDRPTEHAELAGRYGAAARVA